MQQPEESVQDQGQGIPANATREYGYSQYIYELPVRIWHWVMVVCVLVLGVTGYFIGKPLPSVHGEAVYLFYMGYIRLVHFSAGMIFAVGFLGRIYWAFVGNQYAREIFVVPIWKKAWWKLFFHELRWYLFLTKSSYAIPGHNPVAQVAMFGYLLLSVLMILTGLAMYNETISLTILWPLTYVVEFFYWTGGNSLDIHSWHRLGMWLIFVFVIFHVYLAIREDIMSDDTMISTIVNGYRTRKFARRRSSVLPPEDPL